MSELMDATISYLDANPPAQAQNDVGQKADKTKVDRKDPEPIKAASVNNIVTANK